MAATKENLLSLGHMTCTERNTFSKQRENRLKKSIINRPMQTDSSTLQSHQHIRAMHLQKRWEELKERELAAQQHNRQLLQQFEEAQDTLRTMLTLTTAMKTIWMEYERYLDESAPRWQQQFKEKTQAAQKKRMEDRLRSCLKTTENPMTESSADRSLPPPGFTTTPQRISATEKHFSQNSHLDYNQDGSPYLPYMQSSLQTHPPSQAARFPIRASYPSQGSSHALPSFLSPPILSHPFQLHHLTTTPAHHHLWPGQNLPGRASPQSDYHWSWSAGAAGIPSVSEALWGQLYTEEPPPERGVAQGVSVEAELSRASSSKRDRGGGSRSSALSQELDIKPVRLSSGAAESGESSRESSQTSRDKRKKREKRGRSRHTSSERERCSSQEPEQEKVLSISRSSTASSAVITAAVEAAHSTESDASSEKGRGSTSRRRRHAGLAAGSPRAEEVVKEKIRSNGDDSGSHKEESQSAAEESRSEEAGEQSLDDKSESRREELGSQGEEESASVSMKIENGNADETEKESSSSEEKDDEGEEHEKDLGERDEVLDSEEKEDSQRNEQQEERDVEDDEEASDRKNTTDDEDEQLSEDEMEPEPEEESNHEEKSDGLKNKDCESEKESAPSSQNEEDEDESEEREKRMEDDEESDEEKGEEEEGEQKIDEAEENDSDDSIISPQNKSKKLHIIPEEASEDEEEEDGSETGSGDDAVKDFSDEDIEHLLAPQEQSQKKEEKDLQTDEKPEATCDKVEIFQVELDKPTKTDHSSDSEEFDDFYD